MKVVVIATDAKGNIDIAAFRATPKKNALDACQRGVIDYIGPCPPTGTIDGYIWTIGAFHADFSPRWRTANRAVSNLADSNNILRREAHIGLALFKAQRKCYQCEFVAHLFDGK